MNRTCGECSLCCKLLPMSSEVKDYPETVAYLESVGLLKPGEEKTFIKDFHKPAGKRCPYQKFGKGCGQYRTRPLGCRTWSCQWLVNDDTAAMRRPDRSHYVVDMVPDYVRGVDDAGNEQVVQVVQIWIDPDYPGAYRDPALRAFLHKQFKQGIAALVRFGRDRGLFIIGPPLTPEWREVETLQDEVEHTAEQKVAMLGRMSVTFAEG